MLEIVRIGESFPLQKNDISTIYRALASFKNSILTSLLAFGDTGSSGLSSHVDEETTAACCCIFPTFVPVGSMW